MDELNFLFNTGFCEKKKVSEILFQNGFIEISMSQSL